MKRDKQQMNFERIKKNALGTASTNRLFFFSFLKDELKKILMWLKSISTEKGKNMYC